ncbi:hypothetical protein BDQ12DRAFT_714597 [Crucibulum laeve]|uniref:Uncharacterized protein n=1 Tax=Crucibulum laeve TaxID=68775 RepID=A0A5C3M386_9AGAR|nr:hypothetical protein BDQ12DRAFT_714597 [Crucibulum laeve]
MSDYDSQVTTLISSFHEIFQSDTDLSTRILSIIKSNPTTACAEALPTSILSAAKARPREVDSLVLSTKQIFPSAETLSVDDFPDGPQTFGYLFRYNLADYLKDALHETHLHEPKQTEITPTNPTLAAALFSASAIKNGLLKDTKASYHFLRQGLQLKDEPIEQEREAVVALGACLQLSVAGEAMMERWLAQSDGQETILKALNKLKDNNVIRTPGGIRLLEKAIENVQNKFTLALSPATAWDLIFAP